MKNKISIINVSLIYSFVKTKKEPSFKTALGQKLKKTGKYL